MQLKCTKLLDINIKTGFVNSKIKLLLMNLRKNKHFAKYPQTKINNFIGTPKKTCTR